MRWLQTRGWAGGDSHVGTLQTTIRFAWFPVRCRKLPNNQWYWVWLEHYKQTLCFADGCWQHLVDERFVIDGGVGSGYVERW